MLLLVRRPREWPQVRATTCYSGLGSELVTHLMWRQANQLFVLIFYLKSLLCKKYAHVISTGLSLCRHSKLVNIINQISREPVPVAWLLTVNPLHTTLLFSSKYNINHDGNHHLHHYSQNYVPPNSLQSSVWVRSFDLASRSSLLSL